MIAHSALCFPVSVRLM
uniref:Uncharacterized protein n=1 Tax=Anguilla anguilla TaxID=7936 RepID=A0A0E9TI02_ANGAN